MSDTRRSRCAEIRVATADAMRDLGVVFGELSPQGAVLLLNGELGAGKTTFTQGVGIGCGVVEAITSPTYNVILEYEGRRSFTHVDLYRLAGAGDLETIDLDALLDAPGIVCVEWPARVEGLVTEPFAAMTIERSGAAGGRKVTMRVSGTGWTPLLRALDME